MKETIAKNTLVQTISIADRIKSNLKEKSLNELIAIHGYLNSWMYLSAEKVVLQGICENMIDEKLNEIIGL